MNIKFNDNTHKNVADTSEINIYMEDTNIGFFICWLLLGRLADSESSATTIKGGWDRFKLDSGSQGVVVQLEMICVQQLIMIN